MVAGFKFYKTEDDCSSLLIPFCGDVVRKDFHSAIRAVIESVAVLAILK